MAEKYCNIYSKLVQGDGDMVGHIAYSLYKAEKVRHICDHKETHKVEVVPDEVVQEFAAGRDNQTSLEHYRGMAETILQRFIGGSFDDMSEQVIAEVTDRLTKHLDETVVPVLPKKESWLVRFLNGCLQSIGGAIALSLLVWLFANVVGRFSLGNVSVTYEDKDDLTKSEQVTVPSKLIDSIIIDNVKPQEDVTPSNKIEEKRSDKKSRNLH